MIKWIQKQHWNNFGKGLENHKGNEEIFVPLKSNNTIIDKQGNFLSTYTFGSFTRWAQLLGVSFVTGCYVTFFYMN
jgi:hypothetical protein